MYPGARFAERRVDEIDKRLLDIIQSDFPLESRPYLIIGEKLGVSEQEALARTNALRASGIIRRIGANFQSAKVGFVSSLCAAKVPSEKLDAFVELVNSYEGVTHNYERDHEYNVWFTLITRDAEERRRILAEIGERSGVTPLDLPAARLFKIRVDFRMSPGEDGDFPA